MFDRVNLREQVAWSHEPNVEEGKKFDEDIQMLAEDQLRMGIVRVQNMEPSEPYLADFSKRILVVGGGVTGMTAAVEAAKAGYEVVIVERKDSLGGFAAKLFREYPKAFPYRDPVTPDVAATIEDIRREPGVKVLTSAVIEKISGAPGMFDASIRRNGSTDTERVGAIVLATGFEPYEAAKLSHLGFGSTPNVVTTIAVEEMAATGKLVRPSDGKALRSVAFILAQVLATRATCRIAPRRAA